MRLTYVGHSTFKLDSNDGVSLVVDPWIQDNPDCEADVDSFTDLTAVLVTHGGFDHAADAPLLVEQNACPLLCDPATWIRLHHSDFPDELIEGCVSGIRYSYDRWGVKVLDAKHPSMYRSDSLIGPALSYMISLGGETVYHMGDTSISADHELFGQLYDPTVALVPIGEGDGYVPELYPDEAALVVEWLDPKVVIPMHYPVESDRRSEFVWECEKRSVTERTKILELDASDTVELG